MNNQFSFVHFVVDDPVKAQRTKVRGTLLCSVINKKRPIKTQIQLEKLVDSEESRNRYYHFGYFRGQKGVIQGYNNNLLLLCAFKRCGLFLLSSFQGTIYLCMKSTIFRLGRKKVDLWFQILRILLGPWTKIRYRIIFLKSLSQCLLF